MTSRVLSLKKGVDECDSIKQTSIIQTNEDGSSIQNSTAGISGASLKTDTSLVGKNKERDENGDSHQNQSKNEAKRSELTASEKARCERNRQKALLLRQSRLSEQQIHGKNVKTIGLNRVIDTGGGFLIEENDTPSPQKLKKVEAAAPVIAGEMTICLECDKPFLDSYLLTTYGCAVCDKCRDSEDKHAVITKTTAKELYLLSEVDLNVREPILKYVVRKNPRNNRWGDMKLYLRLQIEERALEVWGSPEALEEERKARELKKEEAKRKKFNKKMTKLRQEVRSSLFQVQTSGHTHTFGNETPCNDEEDMWKKTCSSCGHEVVFEKM